MAALPALNGVRPGRQRRRMPAIAPGVRSRQRSALRLATLAGGRETIVSLWLGAPRSTNTQGFAPSPIQGSALENRPGAVRAPGTRAQPSGWTDAAPVARLLHALRSATAAARGGTRNYRFALVRGPPARPIRRASPRPPEPPVLFLRYHFSPLFFVPNNIRIRHSDMQMPKIHSGGLLNAHKPFGGSSELSIGALNR